MKTVLITLAFITASLSLISAATSSLLDSGQTETEANQQAEHRAAEPQATQRAPAVTDMANRASALPSELGRLRAALDSNREELQWVQELLQQAGETLYWAQTRHQQSAIMQRNLEDQLIAVTAAYEARQSQVAQLAGELKAVKASLSANNWQDRDTEARIQALENEREELRQALANRDQQLALMEKELQTARADLKQAKTEAVPAEQQISTTSSQYQACRAQHAALNDELKNLRLSETDARHSLVNANAARYQLQTQLAACSENLIQAKASFASVEVAAGQPPSTPAGSDAMAEVGTEDKLRKDIDAVSRSDSPVSLQGVKFRYDSFELTDESRAILDQVATVLRKQKHVVHEVAGHTDSQGNPAYNQRLSQKRAETVRRYLIARGVNAGSLKARGYGGEHPIADNSTWAGLVRNRRVELRSIH